MRVLDYPLLTDENIDPEVVEGLRERGQDVRTVFDEALAGAGDQAIFDCARAGGRIVVTHDHDFGEFAVRAGSGFIGVVYLRPGHISAPRVLESIDALAKFEAEAVPPFVAVVVRTEDRVRIRLRTVSSAGT